MTPFPFYKNMLNFSGWSCSYKNGALLAKFQPGVLNPFVLICGCLLYRVVSRDTTRETKNEVSLHQIKSQKSEFHPNRQSSERLLWHTMTEVFRLLYVKGLPQLSLLSIMLAMLCRCKSHHVPRCPPGMRLVHCIVSLGFSQFVPAIFTGTDVFSLVENKHCESSVSCSRN